MDSKQPQNQKTNTSTNLATERTDLASTRTNMASVRTRLAAERTLMAWMRTSLSFISFGFTIYKFFQYMRESGTLAAGIRATSPRNLGLSLVILGVVLLVVATGEHIIFLRQLSKETNSKFKISSAVIFSIIFLLIGLFALVNILFRVGPF